MKNMNIILLIILATCSITFAQAPESVSTTKSNGGTSEAVSGLKNESSGDSKGSSLLLGKNLPFFNPGNEIVSWDGKNWNINNNRIFQARFEKYLNAPEQTTENDHAYQETIQAILSKLSPSNVNPKLFDEAFRLLPKASSFDIDAHLCDAIAGLIYSTWQSQGNQKQLMQANRNLEEERARISRNLSHLLGSRELYRNPPSDPAALLLYVKQKELQTDMEVQPEMQRITEINAIINKNTLKRELSEAQTKIEFQMLMLQLFMQRRFQHVVIAARFYRGVFEDGDTTLKINDETKSFFTKNLGTPPTLGTLDTLANEAIRDVREGIQAYKFLLSKNELESATKRLSEAFIIGEYMPEIRTLERDDKRQALVFAQKTNQLVSAIEVKDYTLAESLVKDLQKIAKDFDNSKPMAAIETAKTVSQMHLAKAKNAAVSGDRQTLEEQLKLATELWPRNPELKEVSSLIFSQADVQQKALVDLDQLLSQKNYRQIYEDKVRYIAATALFPDRQAKLTKVLQDMQTVEGAIIRSNEIAKRGDYAGAWESVERVFKDFPDDNKLNQLRATLTTEAAEFVRTIKTAQQLEEKDQTGSSLAWYLKAQKIYPPSEFAQDGIQRLVKKVLPSS
jgi:hypothetical protein